MYNNCHTIGYKKAIELLIEKGSDVNATQKQWSMTPLHLIALFNAASFNHYWTEDDRISSLDFETKFHT